MILAVALKNFYRSATNTDLIFILKPLAKIVGIFHGISFEFQEHIGFFNTERGIVIGKGCAGVNYYIILFCMLVFSFIDYFRGILKKLKIFTIFIISSFITMIFVNSSRIIVSVFLIEYGIHFGGLSTAEVHKATGVIFYFSFLVLSYYLVKAIMEMGENHESTI